MDRNEYARLYYQKHKEHYKEYSKQFYKKNKEYSKQYYKKNKEHYKTYHKSYREIIKNNKIEYNGPINDKGHKFCKACNKFRKQFSVDGVCINCNKIIKMERARSKFKPIEVNVYGQ